MEIMLEFGSGTEAQHCTLSHVQWKKQFPFCGSFGFSPVKLGSVFGVRVSGCALIWKILPGVEEHGKQ